MILSTSSKIIFEESLHYLASFTLLIYLKTVKVNKDARGRNGLL